MPPEEKYFVQHYALADFWTSPTESRVQILQSGHAEEYLRLSSVLHSSASEILLQALAPAGPRETPGTFPTSLPW